MTAAWRSLDPDGPRHAPECVDPEDGDVVCVCGLDDAQRDREDAEVAAADEHDDSDPDEPEGVNY